VSEKRMIARGLRRWQKAVRVRLLRDGEVGQGVRRRLLLGELWEKSGV
jgi:hypothetical protein